MSTLEQQTTKKNKRTLWIVVGGLAVLLIAGIVTALTIVKAQQPKPDQHAFAACTLLGRMDHQSLVAGVISEMNAIDEANKSSVPSLRKAARTESPASKLPTDDPGYKNPADVQATAIAKWCNDNRTA